MPSLLLFQPSSLLWYNDSVGPTGISLLLNADYVNGVALLIYGFFYNRRSRQRSSLSAAKEAGRYTSVNHSVRCAYRYSFIRILGGVIFGPLLLSLFILFSTCSVMNTYPDQKPNHALQRAINQVMQIFRLTTPSKSKEKKRKGWQG